MSSGIGRSATFPMRSTPCAARSRRRGQAASAAGTLVWWVVFIARRSCTSSCRSSGRSSSRCSRSRFLGVRRRRRRLRSSPQTLVYSFVVGIVTIVVSIVLIVPTAFWVRLRAARGCARHRVHHPAAVRHPADHPGLRPHPHVQRRSPLPLAGTDFGSNVLLRRGLRRPVVPVHVPGGRHGPAGDRRPEPDRGVAEPRARAGSRILVAGHLARTSASSLLSGAFLTLAIVVGEFTIATFLRPAGVRRRTSRSSAATRPTSRRPGAHQLRHHLAGDGPDRVHRPRLADKVQLTGAHCEGGRATDGVPRH